MGSVLLFIQIVSFINDMGNNICPNVQSEVVLLITTESNQSVLLNLHFGAEQIGFNCFFQTFSMVSVFT